MVKQLSVLLNSGCKLGEIWKGDVGSSPTVPAKSLGLTKNSFMVAKKEKGLSALIKEADNLFSEIVRREDAYNGMQADGYIKCMVCRAIIPWRQADAAHVFDRDNLATRFDPLNVWSTCVDCNRYDPDHRNRYREAVKNLIGDMEFECLEERSHSLAKPMRSDLLQLIADFKERIKTLKK